MNLLKRVLQRLRSTRHSKTSKDLSTKDTTSKSTIDASLDEVVRPDREDLVIGLDFGTAFTKVVVSNGLYHWAVPFPDQNDKESYLLPSILSRKSGELCLVSDFDTNELEADIDNIKLSIIKGDRSLDVRASASAYLALVFRHVRKWVKANVPLRSHVTPYWMINVGLPTDSYVDQELQDLYRDVTYKAWLASCSNDPIVLDDLKKMIAATSDTLGNITDTLGEYEISSENVNVFPEFVAQLTGYLDADQREDGIHILFDVGSGTTDCTAFNLGKNKGEEEFEIIVKSVETLGVRFLELRRQNMPGANPWLPGLLQDLPDDKRYASKLGVNVSVLQNHDKDFRRSVHQQLSRTVRKTTNGGRAATGPVSGIPIFLCGGGARTEFYKNIAEQAVINGKRHKSWILKLKTLDKPNNLQAPNLLSQDYDRLSVAYGLSLDPFNIGNIIEHQQRKEDSRKPLPSWEDNYVSKDQV